MYRNCLSLLPQPFVFYYFRLLNAMGAWNIQKTVIYLFSFCFLVSGNLTVIAPLKLYSKEYKLGTLDNSCLISIIFQIFQIELYFFCIYYQLLNRYFVKLALLNMTRLSFITEIDRKWYNKFIAAPTYLNAAYAANLFACNVQFRVH